MAKKQSTKRQFDWFTYSRPVRLLSEAQEAALLGGVLGPLLEAVTADAALSLEVRARSLNVYYRGANLVRISGDGPFIAETDSALLVPRAERGGEQLERTEMTTAADMTAVLARVAELRAAIDTSWQPSDATDRTCKQELSAANSGRDLWNDPLIVVDMEYTYGKRRYDLVALSRSEGVTGPGAFSSPRLAFVSVHRGSALAGNNAPAAVGVDLADFAKAVGGTHLERARAEISDLVAQKQRLGLLPAEWEFRGVAEQFPEFVVLMVADDVSGEAHDKAAIETHERLTAKHYPTDLLRFAHVRDCTAALGADGLFAYRAFKEYRRG